MHIPARKHRHYLAATTVLVSSLMLAACGGGDSDEDEETPPGPLPTIATYQDEWLQGECSIVDGVSSARFLLAVTKVNDTTVSYTRTVIAYEGTACSGVGVRSGSAVAMGNVVFSATQGHDGVTFNRGVWTPPDSDDLKVIWVLERPNLLCLLADADPSDFPTPESVADAVAVSPDSICYYRI